MSDEPERGAITHGETRIEYTVVRSAKRRRTIGISVSLQPSAFSLQQGAVCAQTGGLAAAVVVRAPMRASRAVVEDVVRRKAGWIAQKLDEVTQRRGDAEATIGSEMEESHRVCAQAVLEAAVSLWSREIGCSPGPVLVRNQKRIWGSCARDGTLRFNWRLVLLEQSLIDYVVVHELVHLRVRNHQREFWSAVEAVLPDFRERRSRLRETRIL